MIDHASHLHIVRGIFESLTLHYNNKRMDAEMILNKREEENAKAEQELRKLSIQEIFQMALKKPQMEKADLKSQGIKHQYRFVAVWGHQEDIVHKKNSRKPISEKTLNSLATKLKNELNADKVVYFMDEIQ